MTAGLDVLVIGAGGYVGGELLRLLYQHPQVRSVRAHSRSQAHRPIAAVHPTLFPLTQAHFLGGEPIDYLPTSPPDPDAHPTAARAPDVLMLALEHGESARLMAPLLDRFPGLVIDLSADFRIADAALYARYYGEHPAPTLLPRFRYGLCDVVGDGLRGAQAIAAPGCFATAAQLALYPLRHLRPLSPPALFAITGSSGAGVKPRDSTHHPGRAHNLFAYSPFSHRHEAEVLQSLRAWTGDAGASARLLVHSGPMVRGIYLTLHGSLAEPLPRGGVTALFAAAYAGRPLVRLLDRPPELTHAVGGSYALCHAAQSEDGRELQITVAIDNLLKGAAGQAVQAMNLARGLPETCGLTTIGPFPC